MPVTETIVAAATPAGRSALAIVRVDGPLAASIATAALGRKSPPAEKTSTLGIWRDQTGSPIDQVVAVLWSAGRSFTGNDSLEITCHGNPLLVRRITEDCLARGGRLALVPAPVIVYTFPAASVSWRTPRATLLAVRADADGREDHHDQFVRAGCEW